MDGCRVGAETLHSQIKIVIGKNLYRHRSAPRVVHFRRGSSVCPQVHAEPLPGFSAVFLAINYSLPFDLPGKKNKKSRWDETRLRAPPGAFYDARHFNPDKKYQRVDPNQPERIGLAVHFPFRRRPNPQLLGS